MPAIKAEGIYKLFGRNVEKAVQQLRDGRSREDLRNSNVTAAVIDANFAIEAGEIFVVMGLSGSGKSTLLRMVNGLLEPTAGRLQVDGEETTAFNAKQLRAMRREKISMVFQHFALFPHHTVGQNAAYGLEVQGLDRSRREAKAREALSMVGLEGWENSLPSELSGGMQQRVGLARALAADTDILLMDEAFSALDPLIRREMQDQLIELQARLGKTILFITHDLNEAMRLGDRIAMMKDGRVVQIGTTEQILNDPANDYVAQFVQDVDRTHVLTAGAVMEKPVAVLGSEQGPRAAHLLMRQHQINSLVVVDRVKRFKGIVHEVEIAAAIRSGQNDLRDLIDDSITTVEESTTLADLLTDSADTPHPLPVIDSNGRLCGVIARVTLLNALAGNWVRPAEDEALLAVAGGSA